MTTPVQRHVTSPDEMLRLAITQVQDCDPPTAVMEALCEQAVALMGDARERLATEFETELDYPPYHHDGCGRDVTESPEGCRCIAGALATARAIMSAADPA